MGIFFFLFFSRRGQVLFLWYTQVNMKHFFSVKRILLQTCCIPLPNQEVKKIDLITRGRVWMEVSKPKLILITSWLVSLPLLSSFWGGIFVEFLPNQRPFLLVNIFTPRTWSPVWASLPNYFPVWNKEYVWFPWFWLWLWLGGAPWTPLDSHNYSNKVCGCFEWRLLNAPFKFPTLSYFFISALVTFSQTNWFVIFCSLIPMKHLGVSLQICSFPSITQLLLSLRNASLWVRNFNEWSHSTQLILKGFPLGLSLQAVIIN